MNSSLALIRSDPRIAAARLAPEIDQDVPRSILIAPEEGWLEAESHSNPRGEVRAVRGWETLYNLVYRRPNQAVGPNFVGWIDSFTRQPIPLVEMQHWVRAITGRLLALPHRRVREIGCGTGLLIEAMAPYCGRYEASDLSAVAVAGLDAWLASRPDLAHVSVVTMPAHNVGKDDGLVDLIIINSVIQYFPDAAYLDNILERAWQNLLPGGHIVVGDVRAFGMQPMFMSAVGLANAPDEMTAGALREVVHAACLSQSELLVDPGFFHQFVQRHGGCISALLKDGRSRTEMTRYRYDVIIAKSPSVPVLEESPTILADIADLTNWLVAGQPGTAVMRNLPNARLARDRSAYKLMGCAHHSTSVGVLKGTLAEPSEVGIDPADLEAIASRYCRSCTFSPAQDFADGHFNASFGADMDGFRPMAPEPVMSSVLTSSPPLMLALRRLVTSLHGELAAHLASSVMPSRLLPVLDERHALRENSMGAGHFLPSWAIQTLDHILTGEEPDR